MSRLIEYAQAVARYHQTWKQYDTALRCHDEPRAARLLAQLVDQEEACRVIQAQAQRESAQVDRLAVLQARQTQGGEDATDGPPTVYLA